MNSRHAIVLGGSRGVGVGIAKELRNAGLEVIAASSKDINTSELSSVEAFIKAHPATDVLVLNTGGPPKKAFADITLEDWNLYHRQLFVGFALLLQRIKINDGGYIFLISSHHIKEPNDTMILSHAYRLASWAMLKGISKNLAAKNISCINLPLGPVLTDRLRNLASNLEKLEGGLPMKRAGRTEEVGAFVRAVVEQEIKYITGVSINIDGGLSSSIF